MILLIVAGLLIVVLATALTYSIRMNIKLGRIVFQMEDSIPECLEELNAAYARIARVLEFPVGTDDPFIQDVVHSLKMAQRAVLVVANKMVDGWNQTDGQQTGSQKKNS